MSIYPCLQTAMPSAMGKTDMKLSILTIGSQWIWWQRHVAKTCSCRYWQLAGLPCCHAISCILFKTNYLDEYVADCYSVQHFKQT